MEEIKATMKQMYEKAKGDKDFYNLCLSDAKAAYEQFSGKDAPEDIKIAFCDPVDGHPGELSEEDLQKVAGGVKLVDLEPGRVLSDGPSLACTLYAV